MRKADAASRWGLLYTAVGAFILGSPAAAQDQGQAAKRDRLVTLDEHGLTLRSSDDSINFHIGGRVHVDAGTGDTSAPVDIFPKHIDFRRIWIEPKLTINKDLIFAFQYDLRQIHGANPIDNLLASYKGFSPFTITVGNFKEPFSLDVLTSNNDNMFMERALPADAFAPGPSGRNTGAAIGMHGQNWTLAAGIFGGNINDTVDGDGVEGAIRATYAPILDADQVLHFGASTTYRSLESRRGVSFHDSPESFLFDASLVDTGGISGADAVGRFGLEAAWANGPYRLQGEYIGTKVYRDQEPDVFFQGGYFEGGWVINGQAAAYVLESDTASEVGLFTRVQPERDQRVSYGGIGVFEAVARYSVLDLSDHAIEGGVQQDLTVGLNWYPEPYARLMANYIHAWAHPTAASISGTDEHADVFQMRMQIAF